MNRRMFPTMYFYKKDGINIPIGICTESTDYGSLFIVDGEEWFQQLQKDHPEIKGNLFIFADGAEFKVYTV